MKTSRGSTLGLSASTLLIPSGSSTLRSGNSVRRFSPLVAFGVVTVLGVGCHPDGQGTDPPDFPDPSKNQVSCDESEVIECKDGAPGPKGEKGDPGAPGEPGQDGLDGAGSFINDCPDGFSRVGKPNRRGAFCITQAQQSATDYWAAERACWNMSSTIGDYPHLCTSTEMHIACNTGQDVGEEVIDNFSTKGEWLSSLPENAKANTVVGPECSKITAVSTTVPSTYDRVYRCCLD